MKIFLSQMRAISRPAPTLGSPRPHALSHAPLVPATVSALPAADRPESVGRLSWELLAMHVEDAQRRSSIAYAELRAVVQSVVREMRIAGESWERVYAVLQAVVGPATGRPERFATEYEMHSSRSAALVAHMHSWADVERLAELEGGEQGG